MHYHCRPLRYVEYGRVEAPPMDAIDEFMAPAYKWLSHYCGYCPQIWLSRSHSNLTGYRSGRIKSMGPSGTKFGKKPDTVLFGFEHIQGFALDFEPWEFILNHLINDNGDDIKTINLRIMRWLDECCVEEWGNDYAFIKAWKTCRMSRDSKALDAWLKKWMFVEGNQCVVPALNLKSAKKIICRDERQKKKLRKMGFIEDRIHIKNLKEWGW